MPHKGDGYNCGLDLILFSEAFICGFLPAYDSEMLKSICNNGHLISSLASGIPLLGKCSLYSVQLYNQGNLNKIQEAIYKVMPEQFVFNEDIAWPLEGTPYVSCFTEPYPYESYFFHKLYYIPGKMLSVGGDRNCLFYSYMFFIKEQMTSIGYDVSSINGFMPFLQKDLLHVIKKEFTQAFLDHSKNGVLEKWKKNQTSSEETTNCFFALVQFGMHCSDYMDTDHPWGSAATEQSREMWEDTMKFKVDRRNYAHDYDPYTSTNFDNSWMPLCQELFHFAFCHLFSTTIVIYHHEKNCNTCTKIYCPHPTDNRIFYSQGIVPQ